MEEEDRLEGRYVNVQVTALPDDLATQDPDAGQDLDFNEVEVAYKRLVVSEAITPNGNPSMRTFTVDGTEWARTCWSRWTPVRATRSA